MYFTKIRLSGHTSIDLPIVGALPSDKYLLKEASGLGPPEIDVVISETINSSGIYQGARPQRREIVMNIGLNPDFTMGQTVGDLRTVLYGLLTSGSSNWKIVVDIMDGDTVVMYTTGYVKNLEIVPFSKEPLAQLVISCVDQFFIGVNDVYVEPDLLEPHIENIGTAPTGFRLEVLVDGHFLTWGLTDALGNEMRVLHNTGEADIDKVIIDTRPGLRGVWSVTGSVATSILYSLTANSVWLMLHSGDNVFTPYNTDHDWGTTFYRPQYWGI